ncbi:MAG TPA: phosphatidate cytidylyltransferase [Arenibaculum sp.]|nr:phosphatidate cytidylyltransferase [Arenibaculum sp.]
MAMARSTASESQTRFLSALALAPIALLAVWLGGLVFALVVIAAAVIAFGEWLAMTGEGHVAWISGGMALALLLALTAYGGGWIALPLLLVSVAAGLTAGALVPRVGWLALGFLAVGLPSLALILLREPGTAGLLAIAFLLIVVWSTDIAAYFGGRRFGGPKLWPRVSPGKTWSGALSGTSAAVLAAALFSAATGAVPLAAIGLAIVLSVAAQAGDLAESAVKRACGAKDSGRIIPGHGGVLDRVDGLFGAATLALLLAAAGLGGGIRVMGAFA